MVFSSPDLDRQHIEFGGLDVDWYGADEAGHIGYFTSAGHSPIPAGISVLRNQLRVIHQFFLQLPPIHSLDIHIHSSLRTPNVAPLMKDIHRQYLKELREMGQRGLFCFDADSSGSGGYIRLIAPVTPLHVSELPVFPRTEVLFSGLRAQLLSSEFLV